MKTLRGFVIGLVVLGALGAAVWFVPALHVRAIVWALNSGIIPVEKADWGYLKLRSGKAGLDALTELEARGPTKVAQVSVAVQRQWYDKGHDFPCSGHICFNPRVQEEETRFAELWLPEDGKAYTRVLAKGQVIPEAFWQTQRFRMPCRISPKNNKGNTSCTLSMIDMTGSSDPEIIMIRRSVGVFSGQTQPGVSELWDIYAEKDGKWSIATEMSLADFGTDFRGTVMTKAVDMFWVNGNAVNFFDVRSWSSNSSVTPTQGRVASTKMASQLAKVKNLTPDRPLPKNLLQAIGSGNLRLYPIPPIYCCAMPQHYQGLPPCFIEADPLACSVIVTDIDKDGYDDVIVLDRKIHDDAKDYRIATLLMEVEGHWTVVSNHDFCAETVDDVTKLQIGFKPAQWRPVEFAGRLYLPTEDSDSCMSHSYSM